MWNRLIVKYVRTVTVTPRAREEPRIAGLRAIIRRRDKLRVMTDGISTMWFCELDAEHAVRRPRDGSRVKRNVTIACPFALALPYRFVVRTSRRTFATFRLSAWRGTFWPRDAISRPSSCGQFLLFPGSLGISVHGGRGGEIRESIVMTTLITLTHVPEILRSYRYYSVGERYFLPLF